MVIRNARVPAVLVELGFVDSPDEGPKLAEHDYQETLADALAEGVEAFLAQGGRTSKARATPINARALRNFCGEGFIG